MTDEQLISYKDLTFPNTNIPLTNNSCEGCDIYKEARKGKMVISDKCSFCSRNPLKINCGDTYDKYRSTK